MANASCQQVCCCVADHARTTVNFRGRPGADKITFRLADHASVQKPFAHTDDDLQLTLEIGSLVCQQNDCGSVNPCYVEVLASSRFLEVPMSIMFSIYIFYRQESNVLFDRLDITGDHEIEYSGLDAFSALFRTCRVSVNAGEFIAAVSGSRFMCNEALIKQAPSYGRTCLTLL